MINVDVVTLVRIVNPQNAPISSAGNTNKINVAGDAVEFNKSGRIWIERRIALSDGRVIISFGN